MADSEAPIPIPSNGPISCVAHCDRARLDETLSKFGAHVVSLDGSQVIDQATLFDAFATLLQREESPLTKWAALQDLLHQAVIDAGVSPVVLVWEHADRLVAADVELFLNVTSLLAGLVNTAYTVDEIDLYIFLTGDTDGYPRLEDRTE